MEYQQRKPNRLKNYDYSSPGAYFLTLCTSSRENVFWKTRDQTLAPPTEPLLSEYGKIVKNAIENIPLVYTCVTVDYYAVMPDHVHLLLRICSDEIGNPIPDAPSIARIVRQLKGVVTKKIGKSIWQKLYYDHVVRDRADYERISKYIYENPLILSNVCSFKAD